MSSTRRLRIGYVGGWGTGNVVGVFKGQDEDSVGELIRETSLNE